MAIRTKTIEYAFPQNEASLASATRFDFAAITLFIPETTSRTFRSVIIEMTLRDDVTVATSITAWLIGIKLGAVAFNDVTVTDTITNSGEHNSYVFTRDVTSYFATNFGAGASQTCQVGLTMTGEATANHAVKLIITYEFDDAAQTTRIKTVKIPLESFVTVLTAVLTEMGTNQVPLLDTFLPESTKVFRNIFFEVWSNEEATAVTTHQLALALDAEAEALDAIHQQALISAVLYRRLWVRNAMTTNVVHAFKARSTLASTYSPLQVVLVVTYEYDHTASTTILNSIQMCVTGRVAGFAGSAAADPEMYDHDFYIEEPTPITLVRSGIQLSVIENATVTFNVLAGAQVARAYTLAQGALNCGGSGLIQRIDSGGAQGVGIAVARGKNSFKVAFYSTTANLFGTGVTAMLYLNYTSGKATNGADTHNHTTAWAIADTAADVLSRTTVAAAPNIPEASYWVNDVDFKLYEMTPAGGIRGIGGGPTLSAELLAGEGIADGWRSIVAGERRNEGEDSIYVFDGCGQVSFDRYPNDTDATRMAVETARKYKIDCIESAWTSLYMLVTYHAITFSWAGGITNSGGGTVNIKGYRTDTGERFDTTSRVGNGAYSMTWYDNTINIFSEARESATLLGRSDDGLAV